MSTQELSVRLRELKHKLNMHYAYVNSTNVNHTYVSFLENKIQEVKELLEQRQEFKKVG